MSTMAVLELCCVAEENFLSRRGIPRNVTGQPVWSDVRRRCSSADVLLRLTPSYIGSGLALCGHLRLPRACFSWGPSPAALLHHGRLALRRRTIESRLAPSRPDLGSRARGEISAQRTPARRGAQHSVHSNAGSPNARR